MRPSESDRARAGSIQLDLAPRSAVLAAQGRPTAKLAPARALATLVQSIRGCAGVRHSADSIRAHRPPNTMLATRGAHDDAHALSRALQFETRIVHNDE